MIPAHMKVHSASVEPYTGSGTYGETWGAAVTVPCWVERVQKLVVNQLGEQVLSTATVFADPGTVAPPKSKVTIGTATSRVVAVAVFDSGGLSQLDHVEIALQ